MDLQQLEKLERTGMLRNKPALRQKLQTLRLEAQAERELEELQSEAELSAGPQRFELALPTKPGGIGLIADVSSLKRVALPTVRNASGDVYAYFVQHTLSFIPGWYYEAIRAKGSWLDEELQGQNGAAGTFDPGALEGDLYELIRQALDPFNGGRDAKPAFVDHLWRKVVGETGNRDRLAAWYRAAAKAGKQSQMKSLRQRMQKVGAPLPSVSTPFALS